MKQFISSLFTILFLLLFFYVAYGSDINNYYQSNKKDNQKKVILNDKDEFKIYFFDVGEADCILIKNNSEYVLIDSGNNEDGLKLVKYFKDLGITKFKYVIGTHLHEDHIGGMDYIINNFDIDHYYMPDVSSDYLTFTEVIDALNNKNISWEVPKIDDTFIVGDAKFRIIWISKDEEDLNDTSIVVKLDFKNTSYLFTGDATKNVELRILDKNIKSDVLKVSHHGSSDASSAQFLKQVNPEYAVISVGKDNDYHHPHGITLNKLESIGTMVYRTDQQGTIILTSDGENIYIDTANTDTNGN